MGAHPLLGLGRRPSIVEDTDDYEETFNFAWRMTSKVGKPVFNSLDYGSVLCIWPVPT